MLPRQFTLTSTFTIGIPAFFLALAPSSGPWRPEGFLRAIARFSIPAGLATGIGILATYLLARHAVGTTSTAGAHGAAATVVVAGLAIVFALEDEPGRRRLVVVGLCAPMAVALLRRLRDPRRPRLLRTGQPHRRDDRELGGRQRDRDRAADRRASRARRARHRNRQLVRRMTRDPTSVPKSSRADLRRGIRAGMSAGVATVAIGVAFGLLARPVLGAIPAIVMSIVVFAGSAQLTAVSVLGAGGSGGAAVLAGLLLNVRFLPMGVAAASVFRGGPLRRALEAQATRGRVVGDRR